MLLCFINQKLKMIENIVLFNSPNNQFAIYRDVILICFNFVNHCLCNLAEVLFTTKNQFIVKFLFLFGEMKISSVVCTSIIKKYEILYLHDVLYVPRIFRRDNYCVILNS